MPDDDASQPPREVPFTIVHERYRPGGGEGQTLAMYEDADAARAARLPAVNVDYARDVLVEMAADASSWPASLRVERVVEHDDRTVVHAYVDARDDGDDEPCRPAATIRVPRFTTRPFVWWS